MKTRIQNIESRRAPTQPAGSHVAPAAHPGFETKHMNKEIMKLMKSGISDLETGVGGTPTPATGTVALPGRWEKAVRNGGFLPDKGVVSRLFPPFRTFSHLFPLKFFKVGQESKTPGRRPALHVVGAHGVRALPCRTVHVNSLKSA